MGYFVDRHIVNKNLELMLSRDEGGMTELVLNESFGGNAGGFNGYFCAGLNFKYYPDNGIIIYFENIQHIPDNLKSLPSGTFRVALDPKSFKLSIVDIYIEKGMAEAAFKALERTVAKYNKKHGFRINGHKVNTFHLECQLANKLNGYSEITEL